MNFGAAKAELSARGFDYLSDARRGQMLNDGLAWLNEQAAWPWLMTTAAGTAPLTIADCRGVIHVTDTTNRVRLTGTDPETLVATYTILDQTGNPTWWWLDGMTTLRVYPLDTTASLSVRYVKYGAALSVDADLPDLPARWHGTWVDTAVIRAYQDSDDHDTANALQADVDRRLQTMYGTLARGEERYIQVTNHYE